MSDACLAVFVHTEMLGYSKTSYKAARNLSVISTGMWWALQTSRCQACHTMVRTQQMTLNLARFALPVSLICPCSVPQMTQPPLNFANSRLCRSNETLHD
eukprot:scaffold9223_cov33-Prasinocladus_malaysianus.AAC.1